MQLDKLKALIKEIVEQAFMDEIGVYPQGFDLEKFKTLGSIKARLTYVKPFLQKLGQGSSRVVFDVDPTTVLKIAKNQKGLAQNKIEADIGRFNYPVAKVFESGENAVWIEAEKARPATADDFKRIANIGFGLFRSVIEIFEAEHEGEDVHNKPENYEDILSFNDLVGEITSLMADYEMPSGDIRRISSWGVVNRAGKEVLVLVDFGLTNTVYDEFYVK